MASPDHAQQVHYALPSPPEHDSRFSHSNDRNQLPRFSQQGPEPHNFQSLNRNSNSIFPPSQTSKRQQDDVQQPGESQRLSQEPASPKSSKSPKSPKSTRSRGFSFRSNEEDRKNELAATADREERRPQKITDPNMAMTTLQPMHVAQGKNSLPYLGSLVHKDSRGKLITNPDLSNPTRDRDERPLDTIRKLHEAAEGGHNRDSLFRNDPEAQDMPSNRNSRFSSFPQARSQFVRRDQQLSNQLAPRNAYDNRTQNRPWQRAPADDHHSRPGNQSYETVASGAASGSSEEHDYQTDPTSSSEHSSIKQQVPGKPSPPPHDNLRPGQPSSSTQLALPQNTLKVTSSPLLALDVQTKAPVKEGRFSLLRKKSTIKTEGSDEKPKRMSWFTRRHSGKQE